MDKYYLHWKKRLAVFPSPAEIIIPGHEVEFGNLFYSVESPKTYTEVKIRDEMRRGSILKTHTERGRCNRKSLWLQMGLYTYIYQIMGLWWEGYGFFIHFRPGGMV